jgi:polyisoprenyl-teichoic acid--peptidoglycan teichoic acid transferase
MKHIGEAIKNSLSNRKRVIWAIIIVSILLLLVFGGIQAFRILYTPKSLFNHSTMNPAMLATRNPAGASPSVAPSSTENPDITAKNDILNILLIGIDRNQDGGKSSGTDPHADVMMVVAINFKEKKVDLISLPRDTFVHAPEVMNGVYKLNASFNVGGGFAAKNGAGFLKVCDAAKYMLGGIPVDYYYAVDFRELVSIVNTIGGVDYDVESPAYTRDGVSGKQHMDGDAVLFYVRSRKAGPEQGDVNRVNRQKKMMVAIFNQLMKKGKLSMLPGLVNAANSGIFTNTTLQQTLALANFAKSIDMDKIGMHSMAGDMADKASWHYCFTDQKARQELIQQVYGIDVPEQVHCSGKYADWLVDYGFSGIRYLKTAKQMLDYADIHQADFTAEQQKTYAALKTSYAETQSAYDLASITFARDDTRALTNEKKDLRSDAVKLAKLLDYNDTLKWSYNHSYWEDPAINEVLVDFR